MPTAGYSTRPQAGPRGNRPSSGRPKGRPSRGLKKARRKEERGCWMCWGQPFIQIQTIEPEVDAETGRLSSNTPVPPALGNAEGVRGLLLGQGHRQAPFSNARAAQRSQSWFHRPSISGSGARSAAFEKGCGGRTEGVDHSQFCISSPYLSGDRCSAAGDDGSCVRFPSSCQSARFTALAP